MHAAAKKAKNIVNTSHFLKKRSTFHATTTIHCFQTFSLDSNALVVLQQGSRYT